VTAEIPKFRYGGVDEEPYQHFFACLTNERDDQYTILRWLDEHFKEDQANRVRLFVSGVQLTLIKVRITRDEDAFAFRLRWC
jgi:hypothetical protein